MLTAKILQSGNRQAIRIPNEISTDLKELEIRRMEDCFILYPKSNPSFPLRQTIGTFPDDFMDGHSQQSWEDVAEMEE